MNIRRTNNNIAGGNAGNGGNGGVGQGYSNPSNPGSGNSGNGGTVQTIRIEQLPLKIIAADIPASINPKNDPPKEPTA